MPNILDFNFSSPGEIRTTLAERLKAARLARNMQQGELAAAAGVSRGTVQNLETKAQCSLDSLVRMAVALGMANDLALAFVRKPSSIAEMEKAARPTRQRASSRGGQ